MNSLAKIISLTNTESAKVLLWCLSVVAIWRFLLELVNHTFVKLTSFIPQTTDGIPTIFGLNRWLSWDGSWFYSVVERGYTFNGNINDASNVAFFPIFPMSVKFISEIIPLHPLYVGLAINFFLTVLITYYVYRLTELMATTRLTGRSRQYAPYIAALLFLAFPSSLFLGAFYTEGFLILGVTAAIYYALRGNIWVAALFAAVAGASKSTGIIMAVVVVLIDYQRSAHTLIDVDVIRANILRYLGAGMIGLSGVLLYSGYLYLAFGDPLLFSSIQTAWGRHPSLDFAERLWSVYYSHTFQPSYFGGTFGYLMIMIALYGPAVVIGLSVYAAYRYRFFWLPLLALFMILLPASTGVMESMNRYIFAITPLFSIITIFALRHRLHSTLLAFGLGSGFLLIYATTGFLTAKLFAG